MDWWLSLTEQMGIISLVAAHLSSARLRSAYFLFGEDTIWLPLPSLLLFRGELSVTSMSTSLIFGRLECKIVLDILHCSKIELCSLPFD